MNNGERLLNWLGSRGLVPAAQLREALGVSPATMSRLIAAAGPRVVRLGRARATRHAGLRVVAGLPAASLPVFRVDEAGAPRRVAQVLTLANGGTCVVMEDGRFHEHVGLPPVLHDMAPAGFLGRRFARRHGDLDLPDRLRDWSDAHRLLALARRGEDAPGDLILGEESLDRHLARGVPDAGAVSHAELATQAAAGGAGSSAGGETPKFTRVLEGRHLIVKFTVGDGSPSDRRWRDLLVCEELAAASLQAASLPAADSRVVEEGGRRFLEVERFDRVGLRGRRGLMSLGAIDDELFGQRDDWTRAAGRLAGEGLISDADRRHLLLLEAFGMLIGNDDRHFGNVSFFADTLAPRPALRLAPCYDMLPMFAAPHAGAVPELDFAAPSPRAGLLEVWDEARAAADGFWTRVASDPRISSAFRRAAPAGLRG